MTVTGITPPVPELILHTNGQELQIHVAFLLHIVQVASAHLVDGYPTAEGGAREGCVEMVRAVYPDNV